MTKQIACFYSCASKVGTSMDSSLVAEISLCPQVIGFRNGLQIFFLNFRK